MAKLLSSLPVGTLVKDTGTKYNGSVILWQVMEHGHSGDPSGSTALVAQNIISLKCFDAMESSNSDSSRKSYGNNRYLYSNILQWLNSDAAAGKWYSAKHSADAAPTNANVWNNYNEYDQEAGFLSNFSSDMKNALLTVTKKTVRNTVTDSGSYENVSSKIFLLSNTEVGLSNENSIAEGSIYSLFNTSSNRICKPTAACVSKSEYTNSNLSSGSAWYWWLRTPYTSNSCDVRNVITDGSLNNHGAYSGNSGVRPSLVLSSSLLVSDSADTDGAYAIQWNAAPNITTDSKALGDKNAPFTVNFIIKDPDGDSTTAKIYLDGTVVQDMGTVEQGATLSYKITGTTLNSLSNGAHTILIEATDSLSNVNKASISFTKTTSPVTISGADEELGNVWQPPSYIYSVSTTGDSETLSIVEEMDGEAVKTIETAAFDAEYEADFTAFEELADEEEHTFTITATDGDGAVGIRTITFTKLGDRIVFYTDAVPTDEPAERIVAEINYSNEGDATIKVEASNNALATVQKWEDMTEEFLAHSFHKFKSIPEDGYGVSVRVSVVKGMETERIYVYSLGFSFY